jgi:hypothetical protein
MWKLVDKGQSWFLQVHMPSPMIRLTLRSRLARYDGFWSSGAHGVDSGSGMLPLQARNRLDAGYAVVSNHTSILAAAGFLLIISELVGSRLGSQCSYAVALLVVGPLKHADENQGDDITGSLIRPGKRAGRPSIPTGQS